MKTNFKKTTIALAMFVITLVFSCNDRNVSPNQNNFVNSPTALVQEQSIISRLQHDKDFIAMDSALGELQGHIISKQFKRIITDKKAIEGWENRLSRVQNEEQAYKLLAEMYNEPSLVIKFYKASLQFLDPKRFNGEFPELSHLSVKDKASIFSKSSSLALRMNKFKSARISDLDPASQCMGRCSNQLNIDLDTASKQQWADALLAMSDLSIPDWVHSWTSYYITVEQAISSFENCVNGC